MKTRIKGKLNYNSNPVGDEIGFIENFSLFLTLMYAVA